MGDGEMGVFVMFQAHCLISADRKNIFEETLICSFGVSAAHVCLSFANSWIVV